MSGQSDMDSAILCAWERRVAAFNMINGGTLPEGDDSAAPYWAIVEECDKLIQSSTATTPKAIETQIWVALHNSSAYLESEEAAILGMDLAFVEEHASQFEWAARPMVAALRSLRALAA